MTLLCCHSTREIHYLLRVLQIYAWKMRDLVIPWYFRMIWWKRGSIESLQLILTRSQFQSAIKHGLVVDDTVLKMPNLVNSNDLSSRRSFCTLTSSQKTKESDNKTKKNVFSSCCFFLTCCYSTFEVQAHITSHSSS